MFGAAAFANELNRALGQRKQRQQGAAGIMQQNAAKLGGPTSGVDAAQLTAKQRAENRSRSIGEFGGMIDGLTEPAPEVSPKMRLQQMKTATFDGDDDAAREQARASSYAAELAKRKRERRGPKK